MPEPESFSRTVPRACACLRGSSHRRGRARGGLGKGAGDAVEGRTTLKIKQENMTMEEKRGLHRESGFSNVRWVSTSHRYHTIPGFSSSSNSDVLSSAATRPYTQGFKPFEQSTAFCFSRRHCFPVPLRVPSIRFSATRSFSLSLCFSLFLSSGFPCIPSLRFFHGSPRKIRWKFSIEKCNESATGSGGACGTRRAWRNTARKRNGPRGKFPHPFSFFFLPRHLDFSPHCILIRLECLVHCRLLLSSTFVASIQLVPARPPL